MESFNTRASFCHLQRPSELALLADQVKYNEEQCFARAQTVFRQLGYTNIANVALLDPPAEVERPLRLADGRIVPRFVFRWPDAGNPQFSDARIEINASNLNVEDLYFGNRAFWRRPWPITFGTTNTLEQAMGVPASPKSKQMELQVR